MTYFEKSAFLGRLEENRSKLSFLNREQKKVLFGSMLLLPVAALSIRYFGLSETCQLLGKVNPSAKSVSQHDIHRAGEFSRLVDIAANRGAYRANCLKRALVLKWWLNGERIASDLVFGIDSAKSNDGNLKAHAWLEIDGKRLGATESSVAQHVTFVNPFTTRVGPT